MVKWLLFLLCVLTSVVCGDEIPSGPSTPVPPVPTVTQINRALLQRWTELLAERTELAAQAERLARFIWQHEWMINVMADGVEKDIIIWAINQAYQQLWALEDRIAEITEDMRRIQVLLGW